MSAELRVAVLTPPGTGAIATVELSGPGAWEAARRSFRPSSKVLPRSPELHRFWFGTLGGEAGDEVILAVTEVSPEIRLEVHCHGGPRVVRWVVGCLGGAISPSESAAPAAGDPWRLLTRAPTLRTASILLDQAQGALDRAIRNCLELLECDANAALEALRNVTQYSYSGRHLTTPWKVAIAGPPNVGKSSLMNALAGYQRSVVSEIAGTTRDAVAVTLAFDGWPVELIDTAGLREADGLEAEGIERARQTLKEADLILWVMDEELREVDYSQIDDGDAIIKLSVGLRVRNKCDKPSGRDEPSYAIRVSALKGEGIGDLIAAIVDRLVVNMPQPGAAAPYTASIIDLLQDAQRALIRLQPNEARRLLESLGSPTCP